MKSITILAALASAFVTLGAPALAETPANRSVVVSYADLDLSTQAGQTKLDRRIARAVSTVCGNAASVDLEGQNNVAKCRTDTAKAVSDKVATAVASANPSGKIAIALGR